MSSVATRWIYWCSVLPLIESAWRALPDWTARKPSIFPSNQRLFINNNYTSHWYGMGVLLETFEMHTSMHTSIAYITALSHSNSKCNADKSYPCHKQLLHNEWILYMLETVHHHDQSQPNGQWMRPPYERSIDANLFKRRFCPHTIWNI